MTARPVPISGEPHLEQVLGQIHDRLGRVEERMVTKDDLRRVEERMVTKDDLRRVEERMVTKDDLGGVEERMVTKDDLGVTVREMRVGFADVNTSLAAIHDKLDRR